MNFILEGPIAKSLYVKFVFIVNLPTMNTNILRMSMLVTIILSIHIQHNYMVYILYSGYQFHISEKIN
jgi:hypothetical protein